MKQMTAYVADGSANLHNYYRNHCCGSLGRWELIYLKIELYHSWLYTHRTLHPTTRILAHPCSLCSSDNNQTLKTV